MASNQPSQTGPRSKLVLVDGSSYLFRAFHALPALTNSNHEPTGAIHGVIAMLKRLVEDYQPERLGVVFDPKGKTIRNDWYPEYKANRPTMPDELRQQIKPLHEIVEALGFPLIIVDGYEADDVIGTLARRAAEQDFDVVISTGDKDMAQLVSDQITLINTMDNSVLDQDGVVDKFGVKPEQIIDYLTLIGDKVDNIPGVPKVGPKTAVKWLDEYQSLDNLLANAAEIKGKVGENLRDTVSDLPMSKKLVTIIDDLDLNVNIDDLNIREPEREKLVEMFTALEFKAWLKQLLDQQAEPGAIGNSETSIATNYETVLDKKVFGKWLKRLEKAKLFAFDTETTSIDYMAAELVGLSFAVEPGEAAYVPVAHSYAGAPKQLSREFVLKSIAPILENPGHAKIGHHLKYDRNVLSHYGIELNGIAHDTMLESYILNSAGSRHDLDSVALKYLGHNNIHFEDVAGKGAKQVTFDLVDLEQATPYAAEDADVCLRLHEVFQAKFAETPSVKPVYEEIEIPLVNVLSRIECHGVLIDADMLGRQSAELETRLNEIELQAHELAGEVFNIGSPKQLQAILFDKQGLPVISKTPKGQPSTAESVLQELALDYPLPKLILEYRSLSKLKSTYTDKLPLEISPRTNRVHTSYHQAVAATGRLSSSDPNLQNIPIRTAEGRRIRQAFIAPAGKVLIAADYSQIELRIMAHLSEDERLLAAFKEGTDVHRATAAEIMGVDIDQVSSEERRAAKAVNFGLIYGMSAYGLARQLGIERGAAQQYVDKYFERYPGVRHFMDDIREQARERGFVETVYGRRLYLPDINSRNAQRRQYAERTAINAPMQGTAADIIKRAMLAVDAWIRDSNIDVALIMQVHDELVLEVDAKRVDEVSAQVAQLMMNAADLQVPLTVDVGVGNNWDEAH
ncbi:MAG: DNA polymerase I [Gammaproteobacteria bacterium]